MTIETETDTRSAYKLAKELAECGDILKAKVLHQGEAIAVGFTLKDCGIKHCFVLPMGHDGENADGEIELYIPGAPGCGLEYVEDYTPDAIVTMAKAMLAGEA